MDNIQKIKDRCYKDYLQHVSKIYSDVTNKSNIEIKKNLEKLKDNFYLIYPFYFLTHFNDVNEDDVYELTLCGNLFLTYLLKLDTFLDKQAHTDSLIQLCQIHELAIIRLAKLFPSSSIFWKYFNRYSSAYFNGIEMERRVNEQNNITYTYKDFIKITVAQCSFAKCSTAGLVSLSKNKNEVLALENSQDEFHIGLQILDDIQDWKVDYKNNKKSYLLSKVFSNVKFSEKLQHVEDKENTLGKYIFMSDVAIDLLEEAYKRFLNSKKAVCKYNINLWNNLIDKYCVKTINLKQNFILNKELFIQKHKSNKKFKVTKHIDKSDNYPEVIQKGVNYLLSERDNNYLESEHIMLLPSSEIKKVEDGGMIVRGNIFQRTIIVEAYLDIEKRINNLFENNIIREDIESIIDLKFTNTRGGWSYFPEYNYLPPDTDDLAQVLRILTISRYLEINDFLEECIELVLQHNSNNDGTIKTWILDPFDKSNKQKKLLEAKKNFWGDYTGKDVEVTSNFLHALLLYNGEKYEENINKGIFPIRSAQNNDGSWSSIWYWGQYYGTYNAIRYLSSLNNNEDFNNTRSFLVSNQNNDGGWGYRESDPLNTAFVLLTFDLFKTLGIDFPENIIENGKMFLINNQKKEGSWESVPFIRMRMGSNNLSYKSKIVTTAYVLRALSKTKW